MEAFVTVAIISSIVQLVDFSSRCVSKSIELHQSASGVLEDNASIGLVLDHLVSLNDELAGATASGNGVSLQELCKAVSETATELADVLRQLKVCGQKTRWKTMRKAIRSVWSKEKVQELEKRLATFRDELNLHVVVKIR
ncbi:hypothetical protein P154DRAFT_449133 [Amniculicola lignicola CBS 123094]|uniref:NACHT-NTPase and P-loop NTPases N-terminal domain-containing protein n=1 Tax=Amniculicola lignicola CBS 123094 TaxID=1392246 RepID=A0A6A5VVN5_9PLEO|nr:hypothetical protein P154DRAFT_449133 [Amniculicola lignicola CBS 123094]